MHPHDLATELAVLARQLLCSRRTTVQQPFLAVWPPLRPEPPATPAMPPTPRLASYGPVDAALPVLRWLKDLDDASDTDCSPLTARVRRDGHALEWRQTYSVAQIGAEFLRNYAFAEFVGPKAPVVSERLACGVLLLGPTTHYPSHRHEAEEIYVPLHGRAQWLQGDAAWRERSTGEVVHHSSFEPHSLRTGAEPLLALYVWHSANVNQRAELVI